MSQALLVEPALARRLERLSLVTRRRLVGHGQGDRRSVRRGSSLEFADYRHYVHGDDPSRVDWNVYARTDALFVRVYEEEEVLNVHLMVDASRSMDWGEPNKLRYARSLAASLGYVALSSSNRLYVWSLAARERSFGPAWGRGRASALFAFLEGVRPALDETPQEPLPGERRTAAELDQQLASAGQRGTGLFVLISDLLTPAWPAIIRRLAGRSGETVLLHALAPQELRPALGGDVRLVDRETGAGVPLTLNVDAVRLYDQRLSRWREEVRATCRSVGTAYVSVDTSQPLETLLFDTLVRRGVLR